MEIILAKALLVLKALLGLGFLIFIHELGHFIAAKRCGIQVDTFALGFQPTLFGFRMRFFSYKYGETEYVIGMLPFGGYVKMAGEELTDEKTGSEREFASKSPGERAYVLVAGSAMNIVGAFVLFAIAFGIGVQFNSPVIGSVTPASPAWRAGLEPGDRVLEVDGKEVRNFMEVSTTLILAGLGRDIPIVIERGGEEQTINVRPVYDRAQGMPKSGFGPALSSEISSVSAAARDAGVAPGDRVVAMDLVTPDFTVEVPAELSFSEQFDYLVAFTSSVTEGSVVLHLDQEGSDALPRKVTVPLAKSSTLRRTIGVRPAKDTIVMVHPNSDAARYFKAGQTVVSLNGQRVVGIDPLTIAGLGTPEVEVGFRDGSSVTAPSRELIGWLVGSKLWMGDAVTVSKVAEGSEAARLGIAKGHLLLEIDEQFVATADVSALERPRWDEHKVVWWDGQETRTGSYKGELGLAVQPAPAKVSVIPGSAGAEAGILEGDVITKLNGVEIDSFGGILQEVQKAGKSSTPKVDLVIARGAETVTMSFELRANPGLSAGLGFQTDQFLAREGLVGACYQGCRRAWTWTLRIFQTVRALVSREVAVKNLAGPVGMINVIGRVSQRGVGDTILFLAIISLNLGIFNLFPIPILDGGHLMFLGIEKLKGSPVSETVQYYAHLVALVLIVGMAVFVTFHDVLRWKL